MLDFSLTNCRRLSTHRNPFTWPQTCWKERSRYCFSVVCPCVSVFGTKTL